MKNIIVSLAILGFAAAASADNHGKAPEAGKTTTTTTTTGATTGTTTPATTATGATAADAAMTMAKETCMKEMPKADKAAMEKCMKEKTTKKAM